LNPNTADLNAVRNSVQAIAGATYKESNTNPGEQALSITYRKHMADAKPAYVFTISGDKL